MSRAGKQGGSGPKAGPWERLSLMISGGGSAERDLREHDREASERAAARRRSLRAARDVYGAVGFDSLWADGICEVDPGLFSQTLEFSDISYQSARREAKESVFSAWCQLFDSIGEDVALQLSVVNTPIPAEEIGHRSFFAESGRTAALAEEYNRILNDKMREGVSNLVRSRYITFSVGARDVESAVPRLARIRGDVTQSLQRIRCDAMPLDGPARLRAIAELLRPGNPPAAGWEALGATSGLRAKDLACPNCIEAKPEGSATCLRIDGKWCQTLAFRSFGSELSDRCVAEIVDLPIPLAVSLHVRGMDKSRARLPS